MKQNYKKYTREDHLVWKTLFDRQHNNLQGQACEEYLGALTKLKPILNKKHIPKFNMLNNALEQKTGWKIEVVKGLIPPEDFFRLLAQKQFCSSTWLRTIEQLDYLEEPDMFHDIFGHIPLLIHEEYANFMHKFGLLGSQHSHNYSAVLMFQRLYWFTIEFGLMSSKKGNTIYGAGIASSFGETNHSLSNKVDVRKFNLAEIIRRPFCSSEIQTTYYSIDSFRELYNSLEELEIQLNVSV